MPGDADRPGSARQRSLRVVGRSLAQAGRARSLHEYVVDADARDLDPAEGTARADAGGEAVGEQLEPASGPAARVRERGERALLGGVEACGGTVEPCELATQRRLGPACQVGGERLLPDDGRDRLRHQQHAKDQQNGGEVAAGCGSKPRPGEGPEAVLGVLEGGRRRLRFGSGRRRRRFDDGRGFSFGSGCRRRRFDDGRRFNFGSGRRGRRFDDGRWFNFGSGRRRRRFSSFYDERRFRGLRGRCGFSGLGDGRERPRRGVRHQRLERALGIFEAGRERPAGVTEREVAAERDVLGMGQLAAGAGCEQARGGAAVVASRAGERGVLGGGAANGVTQLPIVRARACEGGVDGGGDPVRRA